MKIFFNKFFIEQIDRLNGVYSERIRMHMLFYTIMTNSLLHAKSIILRRWSTKEAIESGTEVSETAHENMNKANLLEWNQLLVIRQCLLRYFDIDVPEGTQIMDELHDPIEDILRDPDIVNIEKEKKAFEQVQQTLMKFNDALEAKKTSEILTKQVDEKIAEVHEEKEDVEEEIH
jgi:hypothetical protein